MNNDANCGGDGSKNFADASFVDRWTDYYGRLCRLPSHTDTEDCYKFYAVSEQLITVTLHVPDDSNFDLPHLFNPSGSLVVTSANSGNGYDESILRGDIGACGYWRIRLYTTETDKKEQA